VFTRLGGITDVHLVTNSGSFATTLAADQPNQTFYLATMRALVAKTSNLLAWMSKRRADHL